MSKQPENIDVNKKVRQNDEKKEYVVQMKKRRFPWWIFLLLLPLLLLIQCKKDITVACFDPDSNEPIAGIPVDMAYTAHFLWNDGQFLNDKDIHLTQTTDSTGKTTFKDLPYSVFSWIFYHTAKVTFNAKSECYAAVDELHNFHSVDSVSLTMNPRYEDLHVKLLDLEDGYPLPDGEIHYTVTGKWGEEKGTAKADAAGVATIPLVRFCSNVKLMTGSCYGYADTTKTDVPARDHLVADDSTALRLRPIMEKFTFFVKNKDSKEPIPDATCTVTLTNPATGKAVTKEVHTSTDGRGIAMCEDAFILAQLKIHASKPHFKDGDQRYDICKAWICSYQL